MAKQQKFKVKIPKGYTARERNAIAQNIISHVIDRTQNKSQDKNGAKFLGYSKAYKESFEFKVAGKTNKVDLTLTEEMMGSLKKVSDKDGEIEIGYDGRRRKLNGKVEGNVKGTYGQKWKRIAKRKPRDFMGIQDKELNKILSKFPLDDRTLRLENLLITEKTKEKADEIVGNIELVDEV